MPAGDVSKELLAKVRARLGTWSTYGLADNQVYRALNRGQIDVVWRLHEAAAQHTAVTTGSLSSSKLTLPSGFMWERLLTVGGVTAKRWDVTSLPTLASATIAVASAANPQYYLWNDGTSVKAVVRVGNDSSASAYSLWYVVKPTDMSDSADPTLLAGMHELLVTFATSRLQEQRLEWMAGQTLMNDYRTQIAALNARYIAGVPFDGPTGDPRRRQ